jgi:hypothetical protein
MNRERTKRTLVSRFTAPRSEADDDVLTQLHYLPGSDERKAVEAAIAEYRKNGPVEIPCWIGGKEVCPEVSFFRQCIAHDTMNLGQEG